MNFYLPLVVLIVLCDGSRTAMANDAALVNIPLDDSNATAEADRKTVIINLLTNRTYHQRRTLTEDFEILRGYPLKERLSTLFNLDAETDKAGVIAMITPLVKIYANGLNQAITDNDENALIEILVPLNNSEVRAVKRSFKKLFGNELGDAIKNVTSGDFQKFLVSLCQTRRIEHITIDEFVRDTGDVRHINEEEWSLNGIFNTITTRRPLVPLSSDIKSFFDIIGRTVEDVINAGFDKWTTEGHLAIVQYARNQYTYFAKRLNAAMSGSGIRDSSLTRIVLGRSEIDLGAIKQAYLWEYGHELIVDIKAKTSGYYLQMLENIVRP